MSVTLVTGPVRSGKSRHAQHLLYAADEVVYVATGARPSPGDPEWARRVQNHQTSRPQGWRTVETSAVEAVIASATGPVLIDCLGTWLTAIIDDEGWHDLEQARAAVERRCSRLLPALEQAGVAVVVVTNEVGWSLVPTTAAGRFFQDELGRLNASVAAVASRVHLVVAGRVLDLTSAPVVPSSPPARTFDA